MNFASHLTSLTLKKSQIENELKLEMQRPMPDFLKMGELKRRKMALKSEIVAFEEQAAAASS